jgi:hypothetical protein
MRGIFAILLFFSAIVSGRGQELYVADRTPFSIGSMRLSAVAFGTNQVVAAGADGLIYSVDGGFHWGNTRRYTAGSYCGVAYGNGYFVAVAERDFLSYSPDGMSWSWFQPPWFPGEGKFKSIQFEGGCFIAWATSAGPRATNLVYASTMREPREGWIAVSTNAITYLTYGGGKFLALIEGKGFMSSTNGFDWESFDANVPDWMDEGCSAGGCPQFNRFTGLAFDGQEFVATTMWTASAGQEVINGSRLSVSADGRNWTHLKTIAPTGMDFDQNDLVFLNGALRHIRRTLDSTGPGYATTFDSPFSPGQVATSPEGDIQQIDFRNGVYLAVSRSRGKIFWSVDLTSWQEITSPDRALTGVANMWLTKNIGGYVTPFQNIVACVGGLGTGSDDVTLLTSTNAERFELRGVPAGSGPLSRVRATNGWFMAVGAHGTVVRSSDGQNWTRRLSNTTADLHDLTYGDELWVAVGASGKIVTSKDNSVFSLQSSGTEIDLNGIAYGAGQFIVVGNDGVILQSSDGTNWVEGVTAALLNLSAVAYGSGRFVAVGGGVAQVSTNGSNWVSHNVPGARNLNSIAQMGRFFLATDTGTNVFYASRDGALWRSYNVPSGALLGCAPGNVYPGSFWLTGEHSALWEVSWSPDPEISVVSEWAPAFGGLLLTVNVQYPTNLGIEYGTALRGTISIQMAPVPNQAIWGTIHTFTNSALPIDWLVPLTNRNYRVSPSWFFRVVK